jgi:hypothetical protein
MARGDEKWVEDIGDALPAGDVGGPHDCTPATDARLWAAPA